ncbi:hypothetical protein IPA_08185 [Ignicoccus pacificus DSM 13166]|uniref:Uncharacterized protein n=1 Tax=Ignicoccus pacificus DSM 13166 TaxID=940294 RepID=A0A977KCX4_9CREN|nr:hypothetical protein IPA_08185 [Ignicoccus pacificus DSM 13166]
MGEGVQCDAVAEVLEEGGADLKRTSKVDEKEDVCIYHTVVACGEDERVIYTVLDVVEKAFEAECTVPKIVALVHDEQVGLLLSRLGADVVLPADALAQVVAALVAHPYAGTLLYNALKGTINIGSKECTDPEGCDPYQLAGPKGIPIAILVRGRWEPPEKTMKPGDIVVFFELSKLKS